MPFTGDVFSYTPGTAPGPSSTTIGSAKRIARDDDVLSALNTTQSVARGGTGGVTPSAAADNLTTSDTLASATTTDLASITATRVNITGTTTITGFGTLPAGATRVLIFDDVLTLTHDGTSLILPGSTNIITSAKDSAILQSLGSGNWQCIHFQIATEAPGAAGLAGPVNQLLNGNGIVDQHVPSSIGNDEYGHDMHIVLTQSDDIEAETLSLPTPGIDYMMRLTQASATSQRFGYLQIIEAVDVYALRGRLVTLGGKMRSSTTQTIRYAVLEWTGATNTVTSDVVNDWTSSDYTAGNFFESTNITVTEVGSIDLTAGNFTPWSMATTLGTAFVNLMVFYWTESSVAQNETLDQRWYLVEGDATSLADPFTARKYGTEFRLCQRYYSAGTVPVGVAIAYTGTAGATSYVAFPATMRALPTVSVNVTSSSGMGTVSGTAASNATINGITPNFTLIGGTPGNGGFISYTWNADARL